MMTALYWIVMVQAVLICIMSGLWAREVSAYQRREDTRRTRRMRRANALYAKRSRERCEGHRRALEEMFAAYEARRREAEDARREEACRRACHEATGISDPAALRRFVDAAWDANTTLVIISHTPPVGLLIPYVHPKHAS